MGNISEMTNKVNKNASPETKEKISDEICSVNPDDISVNVQNEDDEESQCLWTPKESDIKSSEMAKFQAIIEAKYVVKFDDYEALHKWSIENYCNFWEEVWKFTGIIHSEPYTKVLDKENATIDSLPFSWFEGARLNYAENLLRFNDDKIALYSYGESFDKVKSVTFKELRSRVANYQRKLKELDVKSGDIVAGYMPNSIECVEAKLATLSIGAVWSCAPPDFGSRSVIDRFNQIKPRVMFSVTSVAYNGKKHMQIQKLNEIIDGVDSIEKVIIAPFYKDMTDDIETIPKSVKLEDFLAESDDVNKEIVFEQVPFNHPLVILYSSGTTGTPKCIVHSHGGTLIQHLKEHIIQASTTRDDVIFFYTSTGWMMYDWLLSALAIGSTVVLFDGSPVLPVQDVLWNMIDSLGITLFGTSAKYLAVVEERFKIPPKETHSLKSLRYIYSTGSPLKPYSFDYVYKSIKSDLVLGSITGGSDIISLFCGSNVNLPVYRGEIQCKQLGMAIECWNEEGKPVFNESGEFVCTKPFPCMPIYFYKDADFKRYKSSYFEKFSGVWTHGDFCLINKETGGVHMLGRSDGTLNPNGIRFGSADIYNSIENFEEIEDSLCVGQRNPNIPEEERVILFVKVAEPHEFNTDLINKIKIKIRACLSSRHVPSLIIQIKDIPYTVNGKKVEVPVRKIIEGANIAASSSLANPKSLDFFRDLDALKKW